MNIEKPHPPALAVWLLRRLYPQRHREALIGDLVERFREGHSGSWFWRQVIVAIVVGSPSQLTRRWAEISLAAGGTGLIWCVPWAGLFPIAEVTTWTDWGTQAQWLAVIEIVTALLVMPLFAGLLRLSQALGWRNLLKVSVTSTALFAAGDLLTIWWCMSHPTMSRSHASWIVILQLAWIFVTLFFSAGIARRLPSSHNAVFA